MAGPNAPAVVLAVLSLVSFVVFALVERRVLAGEVIPLLRLLPRHRALQLEHGLLRGSFVPPPRIRELRDLTRYRVQQVRDRARGVNRLYKVLEDSGLKLTSVITDVMGAKRAGMVTVLVRPLSKGNLPHTRIARRLERMLLEER